MNEENIIIDWDKLSKSIVKKQYFLKDYYFQESWGIASKILNSNVYESLRDCAVILVKPEALKFRKLVEVVKLLDQYKFEPIYFSIRKLTPGQCVDLWRYQWPASSEIRSIISQKLISISDSLIIILRNKDRNGNFASTYLSDLKGSAVEKERNKENFRSILKPINRMLNCIHASDEPVDIIRELAIIFEWDELFDIYTQIRDGGSISFLKITNSAEKYLGDGKKVNPEDILKRFRINLLNKKFNNKKKQELQKELVNQVDLVLCYKAKLDVEFFYKLSRLEELNWSWELVIIATTYIEYSSDNKKLF